MTIRPSRPSDLTAVLAMLAEARLPASGVADHFDGFLVADQGGRVVGAAGLERYPPHGLLRSVVVTPDRREEGIGDALYRAMVERARAEGLAELWLLTESAQGWFERRGWVLRDRSTAPEALGASEEFRGGCPDWAVCLRLQLEMQSPAYTA
jgi:amino-acid N-acetyltransferase